MFSPSTQYAILALSFLACHPRNTLFTVSHIAEEAGVPEKFLAKILTQLKNGRLLRARKGPGGGYQLHRDPEDIRLIELIRTMELQGFPGKECVLGLDHCQDDHPCPLHFEWKRFKLDIQEKFHGVTLREMSDKLMEKRAHLKGK